MRKTRPTSRRSNDCVVKSSEGSYDLFSVEIKKQKLQARACEREIADCERMEAETTKEIAAAEERIQKLRERLKEERAVRARKEDV